MTWRPAGRGLVIAIAFSTQLSGCATPERQALQHVGGASCFNHALGREYLQLAYSFHSDEFRRKSDAAIAGKPVAPLSLHGPPTKTDGSELTLTEAATLLSSVNNRKDSATGAGAAQALLPMELAHAQGRFDCWATAADRRRGPQVGACRAEFEASACYLVARLGSVSVDPELLTKAHCGSPSDPATSTVVNERTPHYWEC